jgi:hypothetical protein
MGNVYVVTPDGRTSWHAVIPNEHQTKWNFKVPISGGLRNTKPYAILRSTSDAPRETVKSAYQRLVLATQPDRQFNPDARADCKRIQEVYELILAGQGRGSATTVGGVTIGVEIQGMGPLASFVTATASGVVVGSSQGRIYVFDGSGNLREARIVGDSAVRVALRPDGTLGAGWCSDAVLFLRDNQILNAVKSVDWPRALTMLRDDVVIWNRNEVKVMDSYGRRLYALEFSKSISGVVAHGDTLYCATAGALTAFRRSGK